MYRTIILSAALALNACGPLIDRSETATMDEIERKITLPSGALPLKQYARAYANGPNRRVLAVYFIPAPPNPTDCKMALEHEGDGGQVALSCPPPKGMAAGERRWFDSDRMLPVAFDDGCDFIDVAFNLKTHMVESARCHGET